MRVCGVQLTTPGDLSLIRNLREQVPPDWTAPSRPRSPDSLGSPLQAKDLANSDTPPMPPLIRKADAKQPFLLGHGQGYTGAPPPPAPEAEIPGRSTRELGGLPRLNPFAREAIAGVEGYGSVIAQIYGADPTPSYDKAAVVAEVRACVVSVVGCGGV